MNLRALWRPVCWALGHLADFSRDRVDVDGWWCYPCETCGALLMPRFWSAHPGAPAHRWSVEPHEVEGERVA